MNFNFQPRPYVWLKLKLFHYTPWRRLRGEEYSSYSLSTSALDRAEWSASRPGRALAPGKGPTVPIVQKAGRAPEPVWTKRPQEKSFRLCRGWNLGRPVVQPVARHNTDWATRLTSRVWTFTKMIVLEVVQPFNTYQHATFHGTTLTVQVSHPSQNEVRHFWMVKGILIKVWREGHHQ
jgi:hypothetical protein